ncbi:sensor histidine kinase [Longitalea arenae]|uniref:sensor histidine kinase n=1 Tax=Longitalea arenae TaxID=2812558 RepID=UPI001967014B|nr:sensor histidine kinase [Longitalea arenae]
MNRFKAAICCLLLFPLFIFCQEYGYTHYTNRDGLSGSTVYCMTQDKDGFLWFGTEVGLSRFDGTHFKTFTREDGLPDNEVIQLFADSKGRIWISPFNKSVCYYYKGKIHTPDNDPVLKQFRIDDYVTRFAEDNAGNMLMHELRKLHLLKADGSVSVIDSINGTPIHAINGIHARTGGGFVVVDRDKVFEFYNNHFYLKKSVRSYTSHYRSMTIDARKLVWRKDSLVSAVTYHDSDRHINFPFNLLHMNFNILDDDHVVECTRNGVFVYNLTGTDSSRHYLPGVPVSNTLKDREGNIWFSTMGHGVYKLSTPYVLNVKFTNNTQPNQVFAFCPYKDNILVSTEINIIYKLNRRTGNLERNEIVLMKEKGFNPILDFFIYKNKYSIQATSAALIRAGLDFQWSGYRQVYPLALKSISQDGGKVYVSTKDNVFVIDIGNWMITDTIWRQRSTAVFASNDTAYIGTLYGLYCSFPNRSIQYLGEKSPLLRARVTCIKKDAFGVVWVGTYGDGIIGYKDGRVVAEITRRKNGLTSNVCRTFYICGNQLWVGTDKGINKINVLHPENPVTKYTTGDGLSSDIINALYVDSNKVFVGTPEGVTFFDEEKLISQSRCDLLFTDITVGANSWAYDSIPAVIAHDQNSVRFDYVGISYKSGGDIRYRYRLLGLDSNWQETRETFLNYPALPSGDYQLQLQAINKFDKASKLITARFTIDKLLYEKTWFRLLAVLLFLGAAGLLVWLYVQRIRKRESEKAAIIKRINELEQLSRKAQMNPHFIFNSLNSIQQFVMDADVIGANKFISGFSRLIRQTLDFSSKPEISMEEELDYLTNYLELEKNRLEGAFSWSVSIEQGVNPADYYIPPMILQPFVENSVRHGLRYRRDKNGVVSIHLKREGDELVCILQDNGIGRKAAMRYKGVSPINYQSKGMSLTADRIAMYNTEHAQKITMQIDDLEDEQQEALGTRVTIRFPVH